MTRTLAAPPKNRAENHPERCPKPTQKHRDLGTFEPFCYVNRKVYIIIRQSVAVLEAAKMRAEQAARRVDGGALPFDRKRNARGTQDAQSGAGRARTDNHSATRRTIETGCTDAERAHNAHFDGNKTLRRAHK